MNRRAAARAFLAAALLAGQAASPRAQVPAEGSVSPPPPSPIVAPPCRDVAPQAERIRAHVRFLADDLLEGRGTGERGGEIAARYIASQFALAGLTPAGDDGGWLQRVPLVGTKTGEGSRLTFSVAADAAAGAAGETTIEAARGEEAVFASERQAAGDRVEAQLVFAGHAAVAPEFSWDDFKDADVAGKVLLVLVDDPPSEDPAFFGGAARTIYGRWNHKLVTGARRGATGVLLVHTERAAGYGWSVSRSSWSGERVALPLGPGDGALSLAGWLHEDLVRRLLAAAGEDLDVLTERAGKPDFRPVPLPIVVRGEISSAVRPLAASNVVGILRGGDAALARETVAVTAHHDHLGIGVPQEDDSIYNGAADNASGVAVMLELARALAADGGVRRSVLFAAVTGEEGGLRGSEHLVASSPVPLAGIVANVNLDNVPVDAEVVEWGFLGAERTDFWPRLLETVADLDVRAVPDPAPDQGFFYRSDHYNFARRGIPAMRLKAGTLLRGMSREEGEERERQYRSERYHRPADEYDPSWSFAGAVQTAGIARALVELYGNDAKRPRWLPGDELEIAAAELRGEPPPERRAPAARAPIPELVPEPEESESMAPSTAPDTPVVDVTADAQAPPDVQAPPDAQAPPEETDHEQLAIPADDEASR